AVKTAAILFLIATIVFALFEIEPDHRIRRAVALCLLFIAEGSQHGGARIGRTRHQDESHRRADRMLAEHPHFQTHRFSATPRRNSGTIAACEARKASA